MCFLRHIWRDALQNGFCWCLEPNLEKDSFFIFIKSSKISLKSDTLYSISPSGVDFGQIKNKFLEVLGVTILKNQKYWRRKKFISPFFMGVTLPEQQNPQNLKTWYTFSLGSKRQKTNYGQKYKIILYSLLYLRDPSKINPSLGVFLFTKFLYYFLVFYSSFIVVSSSL